MEQEHHKPIKPILVTESITDKVRILEKKKVEDEVLDGMRKQLKPRSHDKERGKTMKITEPKTPYVDSLSDVVPEDLKEMGEEKPEPMDDVTKENTMKNKHLNDQINIESLNAKIIEKTQDWEKQQELKEQEEREQEEKHHEFTEKRKQHYNEGKMMKALLKKNWTPADEEDES